jgi:hypothetical protein
MKVKSKRHSHSYKVKDFHYKRARSRAKKEKGTVSNLLECVVIGYGSGMKVQLVNEYDGSTMSPYDIIKPV